MTKRETSRTAYFLRTHALRERLKLDMPLTITLPDPVNPSREFTVSREHFLSLFLVDTSNLMVESQTVASFYAELALCHRACEAAAARADREYRRWKAEMTIAARSLDKAGGKKSTVKDVEAYYRTRPDYEEKSSLPDYYRNLSWFFKEMCDAMRIKSEMIQTQQRMFSGYEKSMSVEQLGDDDDLDRLEELAEAVIAKSGSAKAAAKVKPPEPEEEEDEDEEESDEEEDEVDDDEEVDEDEESDDEEESEEDDEGEEEEEDDEPPPPPPRRKKAPKKGATKKSRKPRRTA